MQQADGGHGSHSGKAVLAALLANLGIAVLKAIGFALTGSGAMLAESVHSVADSGNQGLLLFGRRKSERAADEDHPFGYGREGYFWAFVVALVLFVVGAIVSIIDGIDKLRNPHKLESVGIAIGILLGAIALETFSFRTALREAKPLRQGATWWQFIRDAKTAELPVVLMEDSAALVGLVIALAAIVTAEATGESRWDAAGSLGIGVLLAIVAAILAVEMRSLLLGESASPGVRLRIEEAIESHPDTRGLIHLRTEHLAADELLVTAKVEFEADLSMRDLARVIDAVEARVRAAVPEARVIYLEPDVMRPK